MSYLPKKAGMSICEVGVGQGKLLKRLATLSPSKLVGVDIAAAYLKKLKEDHISFEPVIANAENLPFRNEFDLITSTDVLEHVLNVGNYLHSIHRSLKKGGIFAVRTPYLEDYTVYSRFKGCKYDIVHLRNFSKKTLKITLKGAGFRVKKFHLDSYMDHLSRFRRPGILGLPERILMKLLYLKYKSHLYLPAIPNWLGRPFFKPGEITAICEKID